MWRVWSPKVTSHACARCVVTSCLVCRSSCRELSCGVACLAVCHVLCAICRGSCLLCPSSVVSSTALSALSRAVSSAMLYVVWCCVGRGVTPRMIVLCHARSRAVLGLSCVTVYRVLRRVTLCPKSCEPRIDCRVSRFPVTRRAKSVYGVLYVFCSTYCTSCVSSP